MSEKDIFRPHYEPAQRIYDAFQNEATKRKDRDYRQWRDLECEIVWQEARDYAQENGLEVPTLKQIEKCEQQAYGHIDYAAKWAYGVTKLMSDYPNARDCEHGRQRGKCRYCELEADNERYLAAIKAFCEASKHGDPYWKKQPYIAKLFEIAEQADE
jgi:hypothetical protein